MSWKDDDLLKEQLKHYVSQNMHRKEIIDFVIRDFGHHLDGCCSMSTLDRMLRHFGVRYIDYSVSEKDVADAVAYEMQGPGQRLGYRALTGKVRQVHGLRVPRDLVYAAMTNVDHEALKKRRPCLKRKKRDKKFISIGVNSFFSIDGHDKLMSYQNSTFPLAIYGMMDQASRKMLLLKCWPSNSDPRLIGRWYIDWLNENNVLAANIRLDKGTETGKFASIHAFLRDKIGDLDNPIDSIVYGPSTSNQIERWWRELHDRLEKYFKIGLLELLHQGHYSPHVKHDRDILSFVMVPIVQREINVFKDTVWNSHRIRYQKNCLLPNGIPNHIYAFPEKYGLKECGYRIDNTDISEATALADVHPKNVDYISQDLRKKFEEHIPFPNDVPSIHFKTAYMLLKRNVMEPSLQI